MSELMDAYWQAPPFARNFATAALVESVAVHLLGVPYLWVLFYPATLWKIPPDIWRPISSFLLTSPGLGLILDTYFVYQYLAKLENGHPRFPRKEDLLWYLLFVGTVILILCQYIGRHYTFLQGLVLSLAYTATQDERGMKASFFFFTVPAQLVPYCMLLVTFLMAGPNAFLLQLNGLLAAHLYDFLSRLLPEFGGFPNVLQTPAFMSRLVQTPRVIQRDYGTAMRGRGADDQASGSSTGASTGGSVLPDSWKTRGAGHRLGGS